MTDITTLNLEAAFIDQKVAGAFFDKRYAYVAVLGKTGWQLGVAVEGESGFNPIDGKTFTTQTEAKEWADGLNMHIGLHPNDATVIICSTMRGSRRRIEGF